MIEDQEVIKTILKHLARIIHEEVNIRPPGFDSAHVCGASLRASLESRRSGGVETYTCGRGRTCRRIIHEGTPFVNNAG